MKGKYAKYLVEGAKVEARKKFDEELAKVKAESDARFNWWQEEEDLRKTLEEEVKALKAELADAKAVIAGYKEDMERGLGIREDVKLADMQFEKGVTNA